MSRGNPRCQPLACPLYRPGVVNLLLINPFREIFRE
jgi:hypothetical protein